MDLDDSIIKYCCYRREPMLQHMRVGMPIVNRNSWQEGSEYIRSLVKGVIYHEYTLL